MLLVCFSYKLSLVFKERVRQSKNDDGRVMIPRSEVVKKEFRQII